MKGQLIIHIGPPKTGTTSLQYYLSKLEIPKFKYLGIYYPRLERSFTTYMYNQIKSKKLKNNKNKLKEKLDLYLSKYKYVVLSEENLLLEGEISMQYKLEMLYKLVENFNPSIIFCIRNPESVYFSYYIEIYRFLPKDLQKSFSKYETSKFSDCFRYRDLFDRLRNIGFDKINIFDFESLVKGNLSLNNILGLDYKDFNFKVKLEKKNSTIIKNADLIVQKRSLIKNNILKLLKFTPKYFRNRFFRKLINIYFKDSQKIIEKQDISIMTKLNYKEDVKFFKIQRLIIDE